MILRNKLRSKLYFTALEKFQISLVHGDITTSSCEAIINCNNLSLSGSQQQKAYWQFAGRSNVDSAIHQKAGPELQIACDKFNFKRGTIKCEVGDVMSTKAYKLDSQYIIHAVGPRYNSLPEVNAASKLLETCYVNCFKEADNLKVASIAVPAISCGINEVPPYISSAAFVDAVVRYLSSRSSSSRLMKIECYMFESKTFQAWDKSLTESSSFSCSMI